MFQYFGLLQLVQSMNDPVYTVQPVDLALLKNYEPIHTEVILLSLLGKHCD